MPDPVIVPRADHPISRRNIDPDALRVLYRLHEHRHTAYLVGGSVRDLILGRKPKDFDIGTSAHPYQIKKLFRNCWIIGRRFRLAHIKFGQKTIEVATFRKNVPDLPADAPAEDAVVVASSPEAPPGKAAADAHAADHGTVHHDNTFGTAEEDAFRRDFTINGLFYDIGTHAVIDYVGGLGDLERRVIRSIGDPRVRFVEDPVRMFRAAVLAARLGFDLDALVVEAIAEHRALIMKASPARLLEEYFKVLRSGMAEASFHALDRLRLLELITPELRSAPPAVWDALAELDRYRQRLPTAPPDLTTTILIGALLVPSGALQRRPAGVDPRKERVSFGVLPVARKDIERLRHALQLLPRLTEAELPPRLTRTLPNRPAFDDALTWLEVFGDAPDAVERWKQAKHHRPPHHAPAAQPAGAQAGGPESHPPGRRRRRRRRRRGRGGGPALPQ
ncbi:MAG: polynucleotide adenylyltransferase PcnB [Vicinamibacterales bacterium]